ncbi:MAG: NADP-dependent malic enzyme, partial [Rhodobacteraceae bacterium]|nr:NADP-dependent malic enzyme [Paracoccaceae bacterium]
PVPFDPRLIYTVPPAVAKAAMDTGVARKPIEDMDAYRKQLRARLDPTVASLQTIAAEVARNTQRIVFAEGEEERSIRAAIAYRNAGYGDPILVARRRKIEATVADLGIRADDLAGITITNARESDATDAYRDYLYKRLQRQGYLLRDCQRMVNTDRNVFAASMVAHGHADCMVSGLTRPYHSVLSDVLKAIDPRPDTVVFGLEIIVVRGRTLFVADTSVTERPDPEHMAAIAIESAAMARRMGHTPRVAFLSYSNFGNPPGRVSENMRTAVVLLNEAKVDFEFDGEMGLDIALADDRSETYPFCRLKGPANVLVMPGLHAANISTRLIQRFGAATTIGPVLSGLEKQVQIVQMDASVSDMLQMALMAAHGCVPRLI